MLNLLINCIANASVGSVIGNISATLITKTGNKIVDKVLIAAGTIFISDMVSTTVQKHVNNKLEEVETLLKEAKDGREVSE